MKYTKTAYEYLNFIHQIFRYWYLLRCNFRNGSYYSTSLVINIKFYFDKIECKIVLGTVRYLHFLTNINAACERTTIY